MRLLPLFGLALAGCLNGLEPLPEPPPCPDEYAQTSIIARVDTSDGNHFVVTNQSRGTNHVPSTKSTWVHRIGADGVLQGERELPMVLWGVSQDGNEVDSRTGASAGFEIEPGRAVVIARDQVVAFDTTTGDLLWEASAPPAKRSLTFARRSDGAFDVFVDNADAATTFSRYVVHTDSTIDGVQTFDAPYGDLKVLPTPDGGFLALGTQARRYSTDPPNVVTAYDALGNRLWENNTLFIRDARLLSSRGLVVFEDTGRIRMWLQPLDGSPPSLLDPQVPITDGYRTSSVDEREIRLITANFEASRLTLWLVDWHGTLIDKSPYSLLEPYMTERLLGNDVLLEGQSFQIAECKNGLRFAKQQLPSPTLWSVDLTRWNR